MIRFMRILLIVFAVGQLVLGLLLWLAPGFFFDEIGPYPPRNDHYMADLATFYLALGAVALVAVRRTSWRVPVLALALIQYALHSLNHLIDIGESDPSWLGPANFASLLLTALLLGWMLRREKLIALVRERVGERQEDRGREDHQDARRDQGLRLDDVTERSDQEAESQQDEEEGGRDPEVARLARAVVREELRHHGDQGGEHGGESILRAG